MVRAGAGVRVGTGGYQRHLLAEVKEELLKDEDGPCAAEDDVKLQSNLGIDLEASQEFYETIRASIDIPLS